MAKNISGSLKGCNIDGIDYRVAADTNISWTPTLFENSMVATSGRAMLKKTKRVPVVESVTLIVDLDELDQLRVFDAREEDFSFFLTMAGGGQIKAEGAIQIESYENEEARVTIQLHPSTDWTIVPA